MVVVVVVVGEEEERMKRNELLIEEERKKLLIEEVLLRLPPPSVARFKSISKWWRRYLSEPPFVDRYEARNLSVLGFFYQTSYNKFVFRAIPSNPNPNDKSSSSSSISTGNRLRTGFESHCGASDNTLLVVNSSNGLLLLYSSMPVPYYEVYNPTTGDKVSVRLSYDYETFATRYMVFGFAFDPYSTHPCFTIVDIADTGARKFRVFSYSSLGSYWRTTYHRVPSNVRDDYALSGRSTFCRGALHWLLEPSGVVSFDVRTKTISFSLINLPGDEKYLDDDGLCICVKKMRDAGLYSNGYCSCRYLGVSGDDLIHIRVTGHSQLSLWALNRGTWSHTSVINVGNLPESLFLGCVLEFHKMETPLLYLRVKRRIFSYSLINGVLQELFRITKEYGGGENCLGFIIPYQLPRISLSIPSKTPQDLPATDTSFAFLFNAVKQLQADPLAITEDTFAHPKANMFLARAKSIVRRLNDDGVIHLYSQLGICQVAAKCFPHLQHVEFDPTGIPVWSFYNLHAPLTFIGLRDTVVKYNDFIRVEGCLYGCTVKRAM
ncbi:putative F-box protein [Camellia lanceoleosa]|uniref:F-box protein n=1 Tax=Camellia lanceoleosa TaxID=1840588 RepID=A0ACC0FC34_9ERIC|nr:putative F-box protein [Camellia lanceoleosa]